MKRLLRRCLRKGIILLMYGGCRSMVKCGSLARLRRGIFVLILVSAITTATLLWRYTNKQEEHRTSAKRRGRLFNFIMPTKRKTVSPCEQVIRAVPRKTILIWEMPFDDPAMVTENLFTGHIPTNLHSVSWNSSQCGNCKITYNQEKFNSSDAVIFHGVYPNDSGPAPQKRYAEQKYVWWSQESRLGVAYGSSEAKDFDWTMTTSRASDVFSPYATFPWILKFLWRKEHGSDVMAEFCAAKRLNMVKEDELDDLMKHFFGDVHSTSRKFQLFQTSQQKLLSKKLKLTAWIASNCRTPSAYTRLYVVEKMEECGMKIDKFGSCNGAWMDVSRWDPAFFEILSRYKFYLSFENSVHCRDYITEKLWFNALYSGAVPVIWGPHRDDVKAVLPPKSYIHVEDFSSVKELVDYLKYLDRNDTAYAEYLQWRAWTKYLDNNGEYRPEDIRKMSRLHRPTLKTRVLLKQYAVMQPVGFCQLCLKLHTPPTCRKPSGEGIVANEREECLDENHGGDVAAKLGVS